MYSNARKTGSTTVKSLHNVEKMLPCGDNLLKTRPTNQTISKHDFTISS